MKMFTKLALVSSIAISANAMAIQSMDDAALSSTTGQDGLNIGIGISKITIDKLAIHDNDGLQAGSFTGSESITNPGPPPVFGNQQAGGTITAGAGDAGAIVIKGNGKTGDVNETSGLVITANTNSLLQSHNLADLVIDTEGNGANGAYLNIAASVSGLVINVGEIGVDKSKAKNATTIRGTEGSASTYNKILGGLTLTTGKMEANIQLGEAPQGAMIKLNTSMIGGLKISNLELVDSSTNGGGSIVMDEIRVSDADSANLSVNANVGVTQSGLKIVSNQNTAGSNIYVAGVRLGNAAAGATDNLSSTLTNRAKSIGDVEISGLKTYYGSGANAGQGAVITISGH